MRNNRRRRDISKHIQNLEIQGLIDEDQLISIDDLKTYLEQAANAAGAYENTAVVTAVDFVVGFENEEISSAEVKAGILEILKEIKTNATLTSDITVLILNILSFPYYNGPIISGCGGILHFFSTPSAFYTMIIGVLHKRCKKVGVEKQGFNN